MTNQIDYYLTLNSPWVYMGGARLAEIAEKTGATVSVKPLIFPQLLERTGGLPLPKRSPERQAYRLAELDRWRSLLGYPICLKPAHFPSDESRAAAVVIAAGAQGLDALALATHFGKALWEDEKNLADPDVLSAAIESIGGNVNALLAAADKPETAKIWEANTEQAIQVGVFGAPSYVFDGEVFWGQDRLDFLERALTV